MEATLVLEDGTTLYGAGFGAATTTVFELVFHTGMSGYQEILSDSSYHGQGVLFTCPHIGNVGVNPEDLESAWPQAAAVVVREISRAPSNWRAAQSLPDWLADHRVPGISEVDTRFLARKLRQQGTQKAALTTAGVPAEVLLAAARAWPGLDGRDVVGEVSCYKAYPWQADPGSRWVQPQAAARERPLKVLVFDFGVKRNILRSLQAFDMEVVVAPASTSAAEALAFRPDGIVLSNGPGDPAGLAGITRVVAELIESGIPMMGICLGHQLIGRALGAKTMRLKFGHHSANHPVLDLYNGSVLVTSQNHNYTIDPDSIDSSRMRVTHTSLNDGSIEGIELLDHPVFSVQFHPEASPGPQDALDLFERFNRMVEDKAAVGNAQLSAQTGSKA